jgi:hypothetical protein
MMWVVQLGGGIGLSPESLHKHAVASQMRGQQLDCNRAVVGRCVVSSPDFTHATAAQQLDQPVPPELHFVHRQAFPTRLPRAGIYRSTDVARCVFAKSEDRPSGGVSAGRDYRTVDCNGRQVRDHQGQGR